MYSTYPEVALNVRLDADRSASVPPPFLIPVIEPPVPSSWLSIFVLIHCAIEVLNVCVPFGPEPQSDGAPVSLLVLLS